MATVVRMPGISADADSATLVEWSVGRGDTVTRGDVIATVETDKAVVELEAEEDGTVLRLFATEGDSVLIGGPIAVLLQGNEKDTDEESILAELGVGDGESGAAPEGVDPAPAAAPCERAGERGTQPRPARRAFRNRGDERCRTTRRPAPGASGGSSRRPSCAVWRPRPVWRSRRSGARAPTAGSGVATSTSALTAQASPGGLRGVTRAAPSPAAPAPAGSIDVPVSRFRRAVASALTASKQNVPHFYLKATCRAEALLALRAQVNAGGDTKITVNDFVVKAAALAMVRVPEMNVTWTGDGIRHYDAVDISVAMATERGLVVPVVRSADTRSLREVSATIKDLAARATANTLKQPELEGGSLAISNLGMYGVQEFSAIINPPQVGILAVGAITPQAVETETGELELARCLTVVLSADHRPVDGALAAQWLAQFKSLIENPLQILV